jgi:hypothetical protein
MTEKAGFCSLQGQEILHLSEASRPVLEPIKSFIQEVCGTISLWLMWLQREAEELPLTCAEVKNL